MPLDWTASNLRLRVAAAAAAGLVVMLSPVVAHAQTAPPLAQDGRALSTQPAAIQDLFKTVWGDRAAAQWIDEHDRSLSGGATASGPRIGFLYGGAPTQNLTFTQGFASGLESV